MNFLLHTIKGRIVLVVVIGALLSIALSEVSFLLLKENSDHAPQRIELIIPAGTAERVAAGQPIPSIPADMSFVVGDTLVVKNEDSVSHQLGPVWVPPGASASLALDRESKFAYACSFQTSRYLGLDVRARVTMQTRLVALILVAPATILLLALYSIVAIPLKPRNPGKC
jgi:hypothetical protein